MTGRGGISSWFVVLGFLWLAFAAACQGSQSDSVTPDGTPPPDIEQTVTLLPGTATPFSVEPALLTAVEAMAAVQGWEFVGQCPYFGDQVGWCYFEPRFDEDVVRIVVGRTQSDFGFTLTLRRSVDDDFIEIGLQQNPGDVPRDIPPGATPFSLVINGVLVGPAVQDGEPEACQTNEARFVDIEIAAGTAMDVMPAYLPAGVTFLRSAATACGETVVYTEREYHAPYVASDTQNYPWQAGGTITIRRSLRSNDRLQVSAPPERIEGATINGRDAIVVSPRVLGGGDVGFFDGIIAIIEPDGFTIVQGKGLPWGEILKMAENLGRGGD